MNQVTLTIDFNDRAAKRFVALLQSFADGIEKIDADLTAEEVQESGHVPLFKAETNRIYAGLDVDGQAKLFFVQNGEPKHVLYLDWLKILDGLGAKPGEMPVVELSRWQE